MSAERLLFDTLISETGQRTSATFSNLAAETFGGPTLSLDTGSFTFTGNAENLVYNHKLNLDTGSFSFTGNNQTLIHSYPLSVSSGSFNLTGNSETLTANRKLSVTSGAFTFTGNSITLLRVYPLSLNTGTFNLTGNSETLQYNHKLSMQTCAYNATFNSASMVWTRFYVQDTGNFSLTGSNIVFARHYDCQFFAPSYHTVFNSLNIARSRALQLSGNYTFTGSDLSLDGVHKLFLNTTYLSSITSDIQVNRKLILDTGTILINGNQIILQNFDFLIVNQGNFGYIGTDLNLSVSRKLQTQGTFYFVGFDQDLVWSGGIIYPQDNPWAITISDELFKNPIGSDDHAIVASGGDYEVVHN